MGATIEDRILAIGNPFFRPDSMGSFLPPLRPLGINIAPMDYEDKRTFRRHQDIASPTKEWVIYITLLRTKYYRGLSRTSWQHQYHHTRGCTSNHRHKDITQNNTKKEEEYAICYIAVLKRQNHCLQKITFYPP